MKVLVIGAGYVGLSTAVLMYRAEHDVVVLDRDRERVSQIRQGICPLRGESQDWPSNIAERIVVTDNMENAYSTVPDIVFVSVPTDWDDYYGILDTRNLESVLVSVLQATIDVPVVVRSTVPIGFTRRICDHYMTRRIVFCPEFLREGSAIRDAYNPSRIVVGGVSSVYAKPTMRVLSQACDSRCGQIITDSSTAEAIKLFSNAYLASRVAFFNDLDSFAEARGLEVRTLIDGVCGDPRIGRGYCNPSFGFGGYCLPKDTAQLRSQMPASQRSMVEGALLSNKQRINRIAGHVIRNTERGDLVGIYRMQAKAGSDNTRSSASFALAQEIVSRGRSVLVYEPMLRESPAAGMTLTPSLGDFKSLSELILANRFDAELEDVRSKVYTRDIYGTDK